MMKLRSLSANSLIVGLALLLALLPGKTERTTAAQLWPGNAAALAPQSGGTWINYTNGNEVRALAVEGDYVWAGTAGGVVRWNHTDGSYVKYTTTDGLAHNEVEAIAVDEADHLRFGTGSGVSKDLYYSLAFY